ncbi:MAG TPA: replication initiator protein A [Pirellulales bacterium]|jgi:hypothetical protein
MEEQGTSTTLKPLWNFDLTDGRDELNLAEFPLAAIANRVADGQKTLTFEDEIWDDGAKQRVSRKLTISGSDQYGLPTARDNDVLLALIHLTRCRNAFQSPTVFFTRYELVKFLQWDGGGKSYRRLEQSLNVLASVTLFYNRAWWDRANKNWRNRTFHILESVDLRGREAVGAREQPLSSFIWNGIVFSSFASNYIKKLNLEVYFHLQGAAARQAYRFLDKRFYHKRRLEFDLRTFGCEHLGMSRAYDTGELKRKLERTFAELVAIGFLKPMARALRFRKNGPSDWRVVIERAGSVAPEKKKVEARSEPAKQLIERGVSPAVANGLSQQFPSAEIERQILAFDERKMRAGGKMSNPAGYLVKAIREGFSQPSARKAPSRPPLRTAPPVEEPAHFDPEHDVQKRYWATLSEDEQSTLEKEAFQHAEPMAIEGWRRSTDAGMPIAAEGYRQAILHRHLERILAGRAELQKAS